MAIDEDYGKLLAALMKKDFSRMTGIDFIAVGGGGTGGQADFKKDVKAIFNGRKEDPAAPLKLDGGRWVWAKRIVPDKEISYLDEGDKVAKTVTRKIRVEVSFDKGVPSNESLDFSRFALLAIDFKDGLFNPEMMFFVDYVSHDPITKDETTKLVRDIVIDFPVKEIK
ncbi:MAG: hypothetical protein MUE87_01090 [Methanothrix sp.]|jgi:hypothetical protein|nr:hypothetical protein [Methanothrix sp.]